MPKLSKEAKNAVDVIRAAIRKKSTRPEYGFGSSYEEHLDRIVKWLQAPVHKADDGRLLDECGQVKCETPDCRVWHNPEWSDGTPRYGCSKHEEENKR